MELRNFEFLVIVSKLIFSKMEILSLVLHVCEISNFTRNTVINADFEFNDYVYLYENNLLKIILYVVEGF